MLSDNLRYFQGGGRPRVGEFVRGGFCPGDNVRFPREDSNDFK